MTTRTTITIPADPDQDDCLSAAVEVVVNAEPQLRGWDLEAEWEGGSDDTLRERVRMTIPHWAVDSVLARVAEASRA